MNDEACLVCKGTGIMQVRTEGGDMTALFNLSPQRVAELKTEIQALTEELADALRGGAMSDEAEVRKVTWEECDCPCARCEPAKTENAELKARLDRLLIVDRDVDKAQQVALDIMAERDRLAAQVEALKKIGRPMAHALRIIRDMVERTIAPGGSHAEQMLGHIRRKAMDALAAWDEAVKRRAA